MSAVTYEYDMAHIIDMTATLEYAATCKIVITAMLEKTTTDIIIAATFEDLK